MNLSALNWSGMFVAIILGLSARYILHVDYPLAWLFWAPGWAMSVSAIILSKVSEKKSE